MKLKFIITIIALLLPPAGLLLSRGIFPNTRKAPAIAEDDLLKKLKLENLDRKLPAADFTLEDLYGNRVKLRELRGKVILLNFWASWCPPCRLEMPAMERLHREFGRRGMVILTVNYREEPEQIMAFFKEHDLTFTTLLDREERVFGLYRAWSLPTTYLINKKGEIIGRAIGYRDWHSEQARAFFRRLLEDKA